MGINKRQRHATLPYLKIDMGTPPSRAPGLGVDSSAGRAWELAYLAEYTCTTDIRGEWGIKKLIPAILLYIITQGQPDSTTLYSKTGVVGIVRDVKTVKPIFHQNAKYLASGVGVGECTRRQNFALPNAKYTNMLV